MKKLNQMQQYGLRVGNCTCESCLSCYAAGTKTITNNTIVHRHNSD